LKGRTVNQLAAYEAGMLAAKQRVLYPRLKQTMLLPVLLKKQKKQKKKEKKRLSFSTGADTG